MANMALLEIHQLHVVVGEKEILKGVDLRIDEGEVHILFGPNGSGKSTLLKTIMGLPKYKVTLGDISFRSKSIKELPPDERARLGIALAFQNPPALPVKLRDIAVRVARKFRSDIKLLDELSLNGLMPRPLHKGFSGGETKRAELALSLLQKPRLLMLDEPDSGVDVDSLKLVARAVNSLIDSGVSVLLVTHTGHITRLLSKVSLAHVIVDGVIVYDGDVEEILSSLEKFGYSAFRRR